MQHLKEKVILFWNNYSTGNSPTNIINRHIVLIKD